MIDGCCVAGKPLRRFALPVSAWTEGYVSSACARSRSPKTTIATDCATSASTSPRLRSVVFGSANERMPKNNITFGSQPTTGKREATEWFRRTQRTTRSFFDGGPVNRSFSNQPACQPLRRELPRTGAPALRRIRFAMRRANPRNPQGVGSLVLAVGEQVSELGDGGEDATRPGIACRAGVAILERRPTLRARGRPEVYEYAICLIARLLTAQAGHTARARALLEDTRRRLERLVSEEPTDDASVWR